MIKRAKTNEELITELAELQKRNDSLAKLVEEVVSGGSSQLLTHAIRCISECVSITDMYDNIIFVNNAFLKTYQYEEEELLGRNISIVRSPNNVSQLVEVILPSTLEGAWKGEILNMKKDGTEFPVFVSASLIKDYQGNPIAMIGVTSDRTEQKKLELERQVRYEMTQGISETDNLNELLKSIHESLKKVLYAENCFIAIFDEKTGLFNFPYFEDQYDLKPEPLAMKYSLTSYVFRTGKPFLFSKALFVELIEKKEAVLVGSPSPSWIGIPLKTPTKTVGVLVLQHYSNENVYTEHDIQFLYSAGSKIAIAIERKQSEAELRESENLLRSITNSAHDAIIMIDSEGLITFWNPAAERIFGYSADEAVGVNLHNLIVPSRFHEAHFTAFPEFQRSGKGDAVGKTLDLEAIRKDGVEISVQVSLSAIKLNNRWHGVGVLRDVTDQKKTEQALVKAMHEAEMANKFKSIFLANMSHEIRTPLNAIIGFSQLMNRDKMLSDQQKEYNISIIRAGEHLLSLINDILELSKIEAGRVVLNPANIDLHSLLSDIQMMFSERTQSKNLQFLCEKDDDLPQFIYVDESKLRQIFLNLIGNALKFTEEGGIAVRVRVVTAANSTKMLVVEVQDSGPGILPEEMEILFRPFEQTSSGINKGSGTGLGLALSQELALLMGGDISVTSEIGKGSIFTFQVEINVGNADSIEKSSPKGVIGIESSGITYRILVVDDRIDNLKVAGNLLKLVGFDTREALNGKEAIEKFESWSPHLVLMDMRMPVMDGYEATRLIKSTEKGLKTPIIALTASTFEDELKKIEALGMQGYIRKPFRENDLFGTIGKVLGIQYIYKDDEVNESVGNNFDLDSIELDINMLSATMLLKLKSALEDADFDLLVKLINEIKSDNQELSRKLMHLAVNYEYDRLEQILNLKEN